MSSRFRLARFALAGLLVLAAIGVGAAAAKAAEGTPRQQQYSNPTPKVTTVPPAGKPLGTTTVKTSGSLPFTGFELGSVIALSLGLVAAGLGVRRLGHDRRR